MKRKETYLSRDFRETAAQRFPARAKELNTAFDMRLSALLAENADASKEKQYHLKRQILPGAVELSRSCRKRRTANRSRYVERLGERAINSLPPCDTGALVVLNRSLGGVCKRIAKALACGYDECPYYDTCTEYGCPELCRCFCDSDDISYTGLHPKLIWERSMTLGRGNDRCDFCMKIR